MKGEQIEMTIALLAGLLNGVLSRIIDGFSAYSNFLKSLKPIR